jgi:hypothetical protein
MYKHCLKMFGPATVLKQVVHRKEFVNKNDRTNHINTIECENRYLKQCIKSHKSQDLIEDYIWWHVYMRYRLNCRGKSADSKDLARKMHLLLQDTAKVYPGIAYADTAVSVTPEDNTLPTPQSTGIADLIKNLPPEYEEDSQATIILSQAETSINTNSNDSTDWVPSPGDYESNTD